MNITRASLSAYKGIAFDLDGVIWRGETAIHGAVEVVNQIRDLGKSIAFVTNNAGSHRDTVLNKLRGMGVIAELSEVITSGSAAAGYLARHNSKCNVFVLGSDGLKQEMKDQNLNVVHDHKDTVADFVVVGFDKTFNYEKLNNGFQHLLCGAKFVACNENPTYPVEDGFRPGTGSLVAALATTVNRQPDIICGKPHLPIMEETLAVLNCKAKDSLFVSDSLDLDLFGAKNIGMDTLFVLTGVGKESDLPSSPVAPKYILGSLADL